MDPGDRRGESRALVFAREQLARGRRTSAERVLRGLAVPLSPEAACLLADTLRESGRHAEARVVLRRTLRRDPTLARAWRALADSCWELRRIGEAEQAYRTAIRRRRDPRSLAGLGALLALERGARHAGARRVTRARKLAPDDPVVVTAHARLQLGEGRVAAARATLLRLARRGHPPAQRLLAASYAGDRRARLRARALRWLDRAVRAGDPEACFERARLLEGDGEAPERACGAAPPARVQRVALLARAAARGHAPAQRELGRCYARADGVARDLSRAARWYRRAAQLGDLEASFALGELYDGGVGVDADPRRARRAYQRAARRGHTAAQLALGVLLDSGALGPEAAGEAASWLQRAARRGSADAACYLGALHASGDGVPRDDAAAARWYRRAARQGHAPAQHQLALLLLQGRAGFDDAEAAAWLTRAASSGLAEAQHLLGFLFREGRGAPRDAHRAYWWLSRAAHQGYAPAQVSLGIVTLRGEGTRFDPVRGAVWFARAAQQGDAGARRRLARCYASGLGVPLDLREALAWATLASVAGDAEGEQLRAALAARLSTRERWDARARAFAFAAEERS